MKKRHKLIRKKKVTVLNLYRSSARTYIAGFPIARGAFYNELWNWGTLETVKFN